ncbi:putative surface anchored protein (pseudogene) [Streptococcus pneumoniae]|nr:putative surface anchored protein (pseudogene) [Streptococcus pneumoniae]VOW82187.1 putative surface anchored protein (pseudogene) [Streptococcus pneumoniae]VQB46288.1 putative surface anchored protein (pseudogene) [Streptococcus pneumoniae]VSO37606.1 putative surface anchored protein (pseudogene) [Streptococcus pneumoniae]VTE31152.1 putative surface anchored protein (pseudogene) [Streptococcus pneumoniae]
MTILGKDTVQQSAKGESVTQEATPEYKLENTPGGDKGGNTGSSDANANEGGGSQAGGSAHTGSQNSAQSQASKQLATEKESAKNAIEKAAKNKQDEIKGAPLSDKEKAELLARVEAEKQAALKEIENAKTMEDVKEAETIGVKPLPWLQFLRDQWLLMLLLRQQVHRKQLQEQCKMLPTSHLLANNYLTQVKHQVQHLLVLV